MSIVRLKGQDAINYAENHGLALHKLPEPSEGARDDLSVEEARAVAERSPWLIWLEIHAGVYPSDSVD